MATEISGNACRTYHWNNPTDIQFGNNLYFTGINAAGWVRVFRNDSDVDYESLFQLTESDDHNNPSIAVQDGYPILVFYGRHNKSRQRNYNVGPNAGGTLSGNFGAKVTLSYDAITESTGNTTYDQLLWNGDDLWDFTRIGGRYWAFRHTPDWADNWDDPVAFLDGGTMASGAGNKVYMVAQRRGTSTLYDCAAYGHPSESELLKVWYFTIDVSTGDVDTPAQGNIANLDGTNLPISITSLDVAWEPSGSQKVRLSDVGYKRGKPCILRYQWTGSGVPMGYLSYLDSGTWTNVQLETAGDVFFNSNRQYVSGAAFDRNGLDEFYLGKFDTNDDLWKIRRWLFNSNLTATYNNTKDTSSLIAARPICPVNGTGVNYCLMDSYPDSSNWVSKIYRAT